MLCFVAIAFDVVILLTLRFFVQKRQQMKYSITGTYNFSNDFYQILHQLENFDGKMKSVPKESIETNRT